MNNSALRRCIMGLAFLVFVLAWAGVVFAKLFSDSIAVFTAAVTAAAFATEGLIWVLAIIGGWAMFASRRNIWRKMRGGQSSYYDGEPS